MSETGRIARLLEQTYSIYHAGQITLLKQQP